MRLTVMLLAAILTVGATLESPAARVPDTPTTKAMLDRARLWQSRNRPDLARRALEKVLRMVQDQPDALALLAEIEIGSARPSAAQETLDRLQRVQPDHPALPRLEALQRVHGADKDQLRAARLLAKSGNTEAAVAALRALYSGAPPSGDLALEYWQLVAATGTGWDTARGGLAKLVQEYPDSLHYRLALAEHLASEQPLSPEMLRFVIDLTRNTTHARQAEAVWRRAMMRLDPVAESIPALREYLARHPKDSGVRERLTEVTKAVYERHESDAQARRAKRETVRKMRQLLADPAYRDKLEGIGLLDSDDLAGAEEKLLRSLASRPNDADAVGAMGLVRLRQGRHGEARAHFEHASQLDPDNRAKWSSLAWTAHFWGLLREARDAQEAHQLELAEQKVRQAVDLDRRKPDALILLARVHAEQGRVKEADSAYRQVLELEPESRAAWRGLIALHLDRGDRRAVQGIIAGLSAAQRAALGDYLDSVRAGLLRAEADELLNGGRLEEGAAALMRALELDASDAWLCYDLARVYARQGEAAKGEALLREQLESRPSDAQALHALALFQSGQDQERAALATLERIPEGARTQSMTRLQRRVSTRVRIQEAEELARSGRMAAATKLMLETESAVAADFELATSVAFAWAELGELQRARALLDRLRVQQPGPPPAWRLRYARLLERSGAHAELPGLLDEIAASPELTPADIEALGDLRESLVLKNAEGLRQAGRLEEALASIRTAASSGRYSTRVLHEEARILRAMKRGEAAAGSYRRILALDPSDEQAYLALIDTLVEAGKSGEARAMIEQRLWVRGGLRTGALDTQVQLAGALIDLKEYDLAARQLEAILAVAPDQPRALRYLGQLARQQGRTRLALRYLQHALAAEAAERAKQGAVPELSRLVPVRPLEAPGANAPKRFMRKSSLAVDPATPEAIAAQRVTGGAYETLAELLDLNTAWLSTAAEWSSRRGGGGTSELHGVQIPMELKIPWSESGRLFFRADFAKVDAGTLELSDTADARLFGTVLLCQPLCTSGSISPSGAGLSLTAGYERQDLWLALGTTPLGFPVQNLVGGVIYRGDLGRFSYAVDALRRPVTSTVLSYAGATDPNTGATWGGVTATGVRLGLSHDQGGLFGAWSSLGLHRLTGKNVQSNNRVQAMAGGYWRLINEENRLFSVGVTGMLWGFEHNAGEFTFGHGGYYSPQSYRSLSLAAAFGARTSRFSYLVRGSVSTSYSRFDTAPFYPTDAALQAQAEALSPVNGVDPQYDGGAGRDEGYSLAAGFEYQLTPKAFVGTRLWLERSPYYAPNQALLYLRYALNQVAARPVPLPPQPVMPTSEF